MTHFRGTDLGK